MARNWTAQVAHFRNSSGSMKDKRIERGGARNEFRDNMDIFEEDCLVEDEVNDIEFIEENNKEYLPQFYDLWSNEE